MKAFLAVLMNGTIFSESKTTSSNCVYTLFPCTHYIFFLGYAFFTAKLQTDSKEMETEVVERKKARQHPVTFCSRLMLTVRENEI